MIYKAFLNPQGKYIGQNGRYYDLLFCRKATGPQGANIGWKEYKTLKAALKALKLKPKI